MGTQKTFNGLAGGTDGKYLKDDFTWDTPSGSSLSDATPLVESGAGSAGTGVAASRSDHVHPAAAQAMTDGGTYVKPTTDGDNIRVYDSTSYSELTEDTLALQERTSAPSTVSNHFVIYGKVTYTWDAYTVLMLHCNGTDESTTFTDEIGKTVTAVGTAQIDTAQKKFGTASGLFDGNSDYLTVPDSADWTFGSGAFTIDLWFRSASFAAAQALVNGGGTGNPRFEFYIPDSTHIGIYAYSGSTLFSQSFSTSFSTNTWYHVAWVRTGNTHYVFVDGSDVSGGGYVDADAMPDVGDKLYIGTYGGGAEYFNGWLDEIRISKGVARWTSNFTAPAAEYSADTVGGYTIHYLEPDGTEKTITAT